MAGGLLSKDKPLRIKVIRLLGTFLTLGLFIYLIDRQDWQSIILSLRSISVEVAFLVWCLFLIRIFTNSFRWLILLRVANINIPFLESIRIVFLGMFVSNFLPSTIGGDGIRFLSLLSYEDSKSVALSTILVDRFVNIAAMIFLLPFSLPLFFKEPVSIYKSVGILYPFREKLISWIKRLKEWGREQKFWIEHPREICICILISWLGIGFYFLGLWLLAQDIGIDIGYFQVAGITVLTYLFSLLPISINGYGVREVAITGIYSYLGYSEEGAITLAIISRLLYLSTTLIGAIWLPKSILKINKDYN